MKERPILFSGEMVRALLAGTKTQTRRVWKLPRGCQWYAELGGESEGWVIDPGQPWWLHVDEFHCPYGQPGDRLWVRETWGIVSHAWNADGDLIDWIPDRPATPITEMRFGQGYYWGHAIYAADGNHEWAGDDDGGGEPRSAWHPSIHMPRAASRITLEITAVRVERLQDISGDDAAAEGWPGPDAANSIRSAYPVAWYSGLWDQINGAGSWNANPWVWVVEFKRLP